MTEPRTAAGRHVLDEWWPWPNRDEPEDIERQDAKAAIRRIEAEAAALDVERLRIAYANFSKSDPATWLEWGDEVDAIAAEYARLAEAER
jgi:hypothetical protein